VKWIKRIENSTALRRRDADSVRTAGADGTTGGGMKLLVQADFEGCEVVVTAAQGE
jgi:hypothetical protein